MSKPNPLYLIRLLHLLLYTGTLSSVAQNQIKLDSLKNELRLAKDEGRFTILNKLFDETKTFDFNKALNYASQFYDLAIANGDSMKVVQGGRMRTYSLMDLGKNEEAVTTLIYILGIAKRNQDRLPELKKQIKFILNNAGLCYMLLGNYDKALDLHYQSLLIREEEGDKKLIRVSLNNIGLIFFNLKDYEHSIQYYLRAAEISKKLNDFVSQERIFINLSLCYTKLGQADKAIETIHKVFTICKTNCDDDLAKEVFQALGLAYMTKHQVGKARENFQKSLEISKKRGDSRYECENLFFLSKIEFELKNEVQGLAYLKESESIAESTKLAEIKLSIYDELSNIYRIRKDFEKSLAYQRRYAQLKDSVYNEKFIKNFTKVQTNYEERENQKTIEENNQVLALQREIIDRQKKQLYLIVTIASLIGILLLLSFYFAGKLKSRNKEIVQKNEELVNLNVEKNNLIGIVAHDLKSPLSQIKGLLSLVKMTGKVDDDSAKYLDMMDQSAMRLNEMIAKILDVEAIESKQLNLKLEKVNLSDVLVRVADRYENDAVKKTIKINRQIDAPIIVEADPGYSEQVLENLLSNAIKFSPFEKNIFVNLTSRHGKAICEIRDEGPGLSESDKKNLFGKYQKLSARPTGNETSTGLGLSIVKKFVEAMNGEIWCTSEDGNGASFFVNFVLAD